MGKHVTKDANNNLLVKLDKRVDAALAPEYMDELKEYVGQKLDKILIFAAETEYISSAGIRVLLFAKQKLCSGVELCLIAPMQFVLDTLEMTGLLDYITIMDNYEGKTVI